MTFTRVLPNGVKFRSQSQRRFIVVDASPRTVAAFNGRPLIRKRSDNMDTARRIFWFFYRSDHSVYLVDTAGDGKVLDPVKRQWVPFS